MAYCSSKAFIDFFGRAIAIEARDEIDTMLLEPGYVDTKFQLLSKGQKGCIGTDECVLGALRDFGRDTVTYASPNHAIQGMGLTFLMSIGPLNFVLKKLHKMGIDKFKKKKE